MMMFVRRWALILLVLVIRSSALTPPVRNRRLQLSWKSAGIIHTNIPLACSSNPQELRGTSKGLEWSKTYFDELMRQGYVACSAAKIRSLMQEKADDRRVPSEASVFNWLRKRRAELGYQPGRSGKEEMKWSKKAFNELMKQGHVDSPSAKVYALMQEQAEDRRVSSKSQVEKWLRKKREELGYQPVRRGKQELEWAKKYFDELVKDGDIDSATKIRSLMEEKALDRPLPSKSIVYSWVREKRVELGYQSCVYSSKQEMESSKKCFDELMKQGHVNSTAAKIHSLMQEKADDRRVPSRATIINWLREKREELGYQSVVHRSQQEMEWSKKAFDEIMEQGHLEFSAAKIHSMMQEKADDRRVPSRETVNIWLREKRKEVGYQSVARRRKQDMEWSKKYFDELMKQWYVDSTAAKIHALLQEKADDRRVPSRETVSAWLREKRKELGYQPATHSNKRELDSSKKHFDELMKQGLVNSSAAKIRSLIQQKAGGRQVPSIAVVGKWLREKRLRELRNVDGEDKTWLLDTTSQLDEAADYEVM